MLINKPPPQDVTAFGTTIKLSWQKISISDANHTMRLHEEKQFYLAIPGIARFLALPEKNCIIIEKAQVDIPIHSGVSSNTRAKIPWPS